MFQECNEERLCDIESNGSIEGLKDGVLSSLELSISALSTVVASCIEQFVSTKRFVVINRFVGKGLSGTNI